MTDRRTAPVPNDPYARAVAAFTGGDLRMAYRDALAALRMVPDRPELLHLLSEICIRIGADQLALDYAQAALERDRTLAGARLVEIEALIRAKRTDEAQERIGRLPDGGPLGTWRRLLGLRLALMADDFEVTLTEIANLFDAGFDPMHTRELFAAGYAQFREKDRDGRLAKFVEALGLDMPEDAGDPDPAPEPEPNSVDVIIPVHNALTDLDRCLRSIRRCTGPALNRIILVDDASDPDTAAWLQHLATRFADVTVLRNAENLGFTRSVLAGIAESRTPFFVLLNSDTVVTRGWLESLWRGLAADRRNAMAGPLSDKAYFQSLTSCDLPEEGHPDRDFDRLEHIAAILRADGPSPLVKVPFLSGFCIMIRRDAYDRVGGLDWETYPRGYWEMQDLALRFIDGGYFPCLVSDAFVAHKRAGSISQEMRASLVEQGMRRIHDRHGSIRVLVAEELCRWQPEVARKDALLGEILAASRRSVRASTAPDAHPPQSRWHKAPDTFTVGPDSEVCLFVAYAPHGLMGEFSGRYLAELRAAGLHVVTCLVVDDLATTPSPDWEQSSDAVMVRENGGYDFGAWADVLRQWPDLYAARRLIFANDSMIGPFFPMAPIIDRIRQEDAGFFALTDATLIRHHAQSVFFGWNARNLSDPALRDFWDAVENLRDKSDVITRYELALIEQSRHLPDRTQQILFPMERLFGPFARDLPPFSPVHRTWKALLALGMPFVKASVLDRDAIETVCTMTGACRAMLSRHMDQVRLNRM